SQYVANMLCCVIVDDYIGIDEPKNVALSTGRSQVARCGRATPPASCDHPRAQRGCDIRRSIGRTIVDHDDFTYMATTVQLDQRWQTLPQHRTAVVPRHDNCNGRIGSHGIDPWPDRCACCGDVNNLYKTDYIEKKAYTVYK